MLRPRLASAAPLAALVAASACKAEPGPAEPFFNDPAAVQTTLVAALFPASVVAYTVYFAKAEDVACPEVTTSASGEWLATGECRTDSGYSYSGTGAGVGLTEDGWSPPFSATWRGWSWTIDDVGSTEVDGTQGYDEKDGVLHSALLVEGTEDGSSYRFDYDAYTLASFESFLFASGEWQLAATAALDLAGTTVEAAFEGYADRAGCAYEFGSGEISATVEGDAVAWTFDGATACDGCIPYVTEGGVSDLACPYSVPEEEDSG